MHKTSLQRDALLAACRAGDTLVVTTLDRLARSVPDARAIGDELTSPQISLSLGGSVYDPTDAVGRLLFPLRMMVTLPLDHARPTATLPWLSVYEHSRADSLLGWFGETVT